MHKIFVAPSAELTLLRDVTLVYPRGLILDSSGRVVMDQMDEVLCWSPDWFGRYVNGEPNLDREYLSRTNILKEIATVVHSSRSTMSRLDENVDYVYMCHPFGFFAYGHFFDSLQRLRYVENIPGDKKSVIHSPAERVVGFVEHMKKFGFLESDLFRFERSVVVPRLWVTPWQSPPAQIGKDLFPWIYDLYTKGTFSGDRVRLYLSRNHVRPGSRGVLNESDVVSFLSSNGFLVVTGEESISQIVGLFHNAEVVVGAHGSLFANSMFCRDDCQIVEYCPDNRVDYSFKGKRKLAKKYHHMVVPGDDNFNIEIPIEELKSFIYKLDE
jgi:capsular polysaccharide biosynthesis protein